MKNSRQLCLMLLMAVIASAGCSSLSSSRDDYAVDDDGEKSLLDLENIPSQVTKTTKTLIGKGENPAKARELYADASQKYHAAARLPEDQRKDAYEEAGELYESAAERWPDSSLEQDALFMAGESYFFADKLPKSNTQYELLLKKFPNSRYLDNVESRRFMIARYWLEKAGNKPEGFWKLNLLDDTRPTRDAFAEAVRVFDKIRIDDPTGKLADDATLAAGNAYFDAAKYIDADSFYTDLRKTFPSSEHQFQAHLLGVKAKLMSYQGPDYSGDPLDDAESLIKQIHKQFPQYAAQHREQLAKAYAEVRFKQAEREWYMGRYYDRRGEHGSARFYYNIIVNDFKDTQFYAKAAEQLDLISDEPDVPPQRMEWLVNLFPETEDVKPLMASSPTGTTRQ